MRLRRTAPVVLSTALLLAGAAAPAVAAPARPPGFAQLVHQPSNNCERGADAIPGSGTPSRSFALVHAARTGRLTARAVLLGALPNATYHVFLIQSDGIPGDVFDCLVEDGTLTTDARGDGTVGL